jgi:hypothetical protein
MKLKRRPRRSNMTLVDHPTKPSMLRRRPEMSKRLRQPELMTTQVQWQRATPAEGIVRIGLMMKLELYVSLLSLPGLMKKGSAAEGEP